MLLYREATEADLSAICALGEEVTRFTTKPSRRFSRVQVKGNAMPPTG
jgi:hypothetical protein